MMEEDNPEKMCLITYIKECEERLASKLAARTANDKQTFMSTDELHGLDCNVKKNCAFVKKLRNMTESQRDSLIKDMSSLNLSKYISEVATSVVEAKLKMSDLSMAIKICTLLHERYDDFSAQLLDAWSKILPKKSADLASVNLSKLRIDIRFFAELITSGIFTLKEGLPILGSLITLLVSTDKDSHNHINIILTFCKHCGDDYAGLIPRSMKILSEKYGMEIPKSDFLHADRRKGLHNLLREYYKSLADHCIKDHKALQALERQNKKTLISKGELSDKKKERFEQAQAAFQKMWTSTQQLADILDEDPPELPPDSPDSLDEMEEKMMSLDLSNRFKNTTESDLSSLWEDEDTRSFYEDLPDLKSLLPSIVYKDSLKDAKDKKDKSGSQENLSNKQDKKSLSDTSVPVVGLMETVLEETEDDVLKVDSEDEVPNLNEDDGTGTDDDSTRDVNNEKEDALTDKTNKTVAPTAANKVVLEAFLTSLLNCVNRDMIDKAAFNFCTNLNTKYTRKKLVRALFTVPRTRLDLLPFYSRLVATLAPIMPTVANDLVQLLKQDFRFHIKKKDQINIESKIKNVRFIGELVKFKIFPQSEALLCLKLLLYDFSHHQIEMTCNLLETCGRYLYRSSDSHHRCKLLLDQMMRKKSLLPYESRYITMIENAYYFANPPEAPSFSRTERPPMHEYIRKLLYKDLCRSNLEKILILIRKLDWDDPDVSSYAIKCFISIWNVKFLNIRCVANLLAGLVQYQDWAIPQVIDGVLEDIRLMMEINHPKYNQRRISVMRYVGELYNYRLIESGVVFKVLYSLITFGIYYDAPSDFFSELDPPDHLFRIRKVCQLLETCGQYFHSGGSKKKLDCFIIFFQRYFWFKKTSQAFNENYPFPVSIEFIFKDTILSLRAKFKFAQSREEAFDAVDNIIKDLKPKLVEMFPNLNCETSSSTENGIDSVTDKQKQLNPIAEIDEEDSESCFVDDDCESDDESGSDNERVRIASSDQGNKHRFSNTDDGSDDNERDDGVAVSKRQPSKLVPCPEDDQFQEEFDKIMSESLMSRNQDQPRASVNDIVIPMNKLVAAKKSVAHSEATGSRSVDNQMQGGSLMSEKKGSTLNLMVMTRAKGNKPLLKPVQVPIDSDLALSLKEKEEAERVEKQQVKQLTLHINQRRELEENQTDERNNSLLMINFNRESRKKYQHPRGAPDIDLIFGSKS